MATTSTRATQALERASVEFAVHTYDMDTLDDSITYGEAVAAQLGVAADRLFKTLLFTVDGGPVVAITPVDSRVSTKKLATAAGGKRAEMVDPATAERLTGYVTGGISPFGQRRPLPVFVHELLTVHETVYVSGGRRGLQIELAPSALLEILGAQIADLTD